MRRSLALTSAALSLLCAACGGDDEAAAPTEELQDTRSNVTGTHPVVMMITNAQGNHVPDFDKATLELSSEARSRNELRVSLSPFDCDLTATMTGKSTFALNPGTCHLLIPPHDYQFGCAFDLDITRGTGGRDTADGSVGVTFTAGYRRDCADYHAPFTADVTVTLLGT
ncbi:hypothetical protein KH5H1_62960 [Corallococcus caeni]|uniref:hypothetical protein n=1 Tax=Corallococcus caeni TaxID=3082388 RepID=UPI002956E91C|nr:hypothetical protein KH5H1_62960 [Corallococcus sp. KH5-1]